VKYSRWFLVAIFALAFVLRFWQLGNVPASISNDEAAYIYSAYSIWKTGSDIAGHHLPLSINLDNSFSPVPVYVIAPFVGLFDLNAFWGRFPFALMGFLSVVLLYFIVKQLLNERIALFSAFAFAVSPWHLQLSRSTLDGISGLFFFLLGFCVFLKKYKNGSILWSLPLFMIAKKG
jgi:4-amino-4-deoxy-L-arabinose transferase-like glycosyltransferase